MSTVVLIAAGGAAWEPAALGRLDRTPGLVVLKRCVDVDELLAAAAAGQADAAVVAAELPGLDPSAVDQLRHHGVRTVAVTPPGPTAEAARARALRVGLTRVLGEDDLAALPAALVAAADPALDPGPLLDEEPASEARVGSGGRVVAVWGPAGAPGRTTVATAVAAELARRRLATVLVDADPYGGAVAPLLGILDEVSGLLSAARLATSGELADGLPSALRALGPHLGVLTGLPRPDRWSELRPGLLAEIAACGRALGYVVVDTGFSLEDAAGVVGRTGRNQTTLDALGAADELLVVGTPDPVGLARLARGLVDLRDAVPRPAHVVVNRMRGTLGWTEREVAAMLAGVVRTASVRFLPDDRATLDGAAVEARTFVEGAPDAPLTRAVARLVDGFAPPLVGRRVDRSRRRRRPSP